MSTWMRDMERRVRNVETAPKLLTIQYGRVRPVDTWLACTSATFVTVWEFPLGRIVNDALQVYVTVLPADATTAGEVRLRVLGQTSAVQTIPAGIQTQAQWNWLVPTMADYQGTAGSIVQIQACRTAGVANLQVYDPDVALQCSGFSINATVTGV